MAIMKERGSEHNLQIWMRKCRHFNGVQSKVCKAGVNYDDVVPIPCIGRDDAEVKQAVCDKKSCWTREEAIGIEKERAASTKKFLVGLNRVPRWCMKYWKTRCTSRPRRGGPDV